MITQALISLLKTCASFALGLFPTTTIPDWAGQMTDWITELNGYLVSVSAWLPFDWMGVVLTVFIAVVLAALAIKVVRIIASFLTLGGGSAA